MISDIEAHLGRLPYPDQIDPELDQAQGKIVHCNIGGGSGQDLTSFRNKVESSEDETSQCCRLSSSRRSL